MISFEILKPRPPNKFDAFKARMEAVRQGRNLRGPGGFNLNPTSEALLAQQIEEHLGIPGNTDPEAVRLANQLRMAEGQKPVPWMPVGGSGISALAMGKHAYAHWLNVMVYNKFPKGTLVTMRGEPFVPGQLPKMWFTVTEIQEIHWNATMDTELREPKALQLTSGKYALECWYAPGRLRPLQPEEIKAVNDYIRNKVEAQRIVDADNPEAGSSCVRGDDATTAAPDDSAENS